MPHNNCFVSYTVTRCKMLAFFIQIDNVCCYVSHMVVGISAPRYGQPYHFQIGITIFARIRVAVGQNGTNLNSPHATLYIDFDG